jgi:hypothetical protein
MLLQRLEPQWRRTCAAIDALEVEVRRIAVDGAVVALVSYGVIQLDGVMQDR